MVSVAVGCEPAVEIWLAEWGTLNMKKPPSPITRATTKIQAISARRGLRAGSGEVWVGVAMVDTP